MRMRRSPRAARLARMARGETWPFSTGRATWIRYLASGQAPSRVMMRRSHAVIAQCAGAGRQPAVGIDDDADRMRAARPAAP